MTELQRVWMEVVVAKIRCYPGIFLEGQRKITKGLGIVDVPAEIRISHFPDTGQRLS
jgi:hypothetical protein